MKTQLHSIARCWLVPALLVATACCGLAQTNPPAGQEPSPAPPPSAPARRSQAELEKLAMPIALHPDPLISIILPASAYPVEVVQAARFVKDTNNIPKIDEQPWDENVKAVAKFPELIAMMDKDLAWTAKLGQAFVEQPKELMDTIQALRAKAQKAGTLQTTAQQIVTVTNVVIIQTNVAQVVTVTNQIVQVQPANPQIVYVPTYPSTVYYPPPAYVYDPWAPLVTFGAAVAVGAIIANNCDWHGGGIYVGHGGMVVWGGGGYHSDVDVDIDRNVNRGERPTPQSGNRAANTSARPTQQKWQPDQSRMRSSGATPSADTREARGWGGSSAQPGQRPAGGSVGARPAQQPSANFSQRPSAATQPARTPGAGQSPATAQRPASASSGARSTTTWQQPAASRSASSSSVNRGSSSSSAFSGVSSGSSARSFSSRGAVSRGGGGARGGGGRGR